MRLLCAFGFALGVLGGAPSDAQAKGTFFVLELSGGLGEPTYAQGTPSMVYGLAGGLSLKLRRLPLRWYFLGNIVGRNGSLYGHYLGGTYSGHRMDLDVFFSVRTIVPIWRMIRFYGEFGIGRRHIAGSLERADLQPLNEGSNETLLVAALGLQARLSPRFSVGIRGELTPIGGSDDIITHAAGARVTDNRLSAFAQLGIHF